MRIRRELNARLLANQLTGLNGMEHVETDSVGRHLTPRICSKRLSADVASSPGLCPADLEYHLIQSVCVARQRIFVVGESVAAEALEVMSGQTQGPSR